MEQFKYKLAGVYRDRADAERALEHLVNSGIAPEQVRCAWPDDTHVDRKVEPETRATRNHLIRNALIGTVVGTVLGLAATGLIAAYQDALFASQPLWGPLIVTGYGSAIGLVAGTLTALRVREGRLAAGVMDAVSGGAYALIIQARDSREARHAERLLEELPARKKILH